MNRLSLAILSFVAGLILSDVTRPSTQASGASADAQASGMETGLQAGRVKRADARRDGTETAETEALHHEFADECAGLWIRMSGAKFRGPLKCAPDADLRKARPMPSYILSMPTTGDR